MSSTREKLTNMFTKVMAGTVTREEGTMLLNHLAKEDLAETVKELSYLMETPPPGVFPKTILHTITLSRNKAFHDIIVSSLDNNDEELSVIASQELARLRTPEAMDVLVAHLNSEAYHVRRASAQAIAQSSPEGLEVLKKHILESAEPFFRLTSAQALVRAGRNGVNVLLSILDSAAEPALSSVTEAFESAGKDMGNEEVPRIFDALMRAGDKKDSKSVVGLLKVAGALKGKAKGFEGFVKAFTDDPSEPVRTEARNALKEITAAAAAG